MFLFFRKKNVIGKLFQTEKKMTASRFLILLCVFLVFGMIASQINDGLESNFNKSGMTMYPPVLLEALSCESIPMLLTAWILAPIGEELIFRGLLLRHLEKYGKLPAILITAVLFGAFHMNLPQSINAFLLGLVLGYVAMEYSIVWSMLLHAVQNLVVCSVLPAIAGGLSTTTAAMLTFWGILACLAVAADAIVRNWKNIRQWIDNCKGKDGHMAWILSSVSVLAFLGLSFVLTDMFIVPL